METEKTYVGPRLVTMVVLQDDLKTYGQNDVLVVHYDGGYKETLTKRTYELVRTPEPSDFTMVRNKKFAAMTRDIYKVLAQYLINASDEAAEIKPLRTKFLQDAIVVVSEYDLKVMEVDAFLNPMQAEIIGVLNTLGAEFDNTMYRATNWLWTQDDTQFIPGVNVMEERTLLESKKVISQIPNLAPKVKEEKKDEPKG